MSTVFTKVLQGELPGRFVFRDDRCAVFLTIAPINPGHLLVIPVQEVDHWDDLEPELAAHLFLVAQRAAKSSRAYSEALSERAGSSKQRADKQARLNRIRAEAQSDTAREALVVRKLNSVCHPQ